MKNFFVACLLTCIGVALAKHVEKTCDETFEGCNLRAGECVCGQETGCKNPFPYKNERQCVKDLKGEFNKCNQNPCENGECFQIKVNDHRKPWCACSGSGYYGKHCQLECPSVVGALPVDFPVDCIF